MKQCLAKLQGVTGGRFSTNVFVRISFCFSVAFSRLFTRNSPTYLQRHSIKRQVDLPTFQLSIRRDYPPFPSKDPVAFSSLRSVPSDVERESRESSTRGVKNISNEQSFPRGFTDYENAPYQTVFDVSSERCYDSSLHRFPLSFLSLFFSSTRFSVR